MNRVWILALRTAAAWACAALLGAGCGSPAESEPAAASESGTPGASEESGMTAAPGEPGAETPPPRIEPAMDGNPVKLLYGLDYSSSCFGCRLWRGVIEVENRAPGQEVAVVYQLVNSGLVGEVKATRARTLPSGREIWTFDKVGGAGTVTFSVRFRNGTETKWDSNDGAGYTGRLYSDTATEWPIGAGRDVAVTSRRVTPGLFSWSKRTLHAELLVRNRTPTKDVRLVYSTNGWSTVNQGRFEYVAGGGGPGGEKWKIAQELPSSTKEVAFAVVSRQDGTESWDNNYNQNFTCRVDPMDWKTWTCTGEAQVF